MVIDQGTMLDRVDYNIEKMTVEVKAADKELVVATGYQRRSTKRWIILLLLIVIAGLLILLLIKPRKTTDGKPEQRIEQKKKGNAAPFRASVPKLRIRYKADFVT